MTNPEIDTLHDQAVALIVRVKRASTAFVPKLKGSPKTGKRDIILRILLAGMCGAIAPYFTAEAAWFEKQDTKVQGSWRCGNDAMTFENQQVVTEVLSGYGAGGATWATFDFENGQFRTQTTKVRVMVDDPFQRNMIVQKMARQGDMSGAQTLMQNGYFDSRVNIVDVSKVVRLDADVFEYQPVESTKNGVREPQVGRVVHCDKERPPTPEEIAAQQKAEAESQAAATAAATAARVEQDRRQAEQAEELKKQEQAKANAEARRQREEDVRRQAEDQRRQEEERKRAELRRRQMEAIELTRAKAEAKLKNLPAPAESGEVNQTVGAAITAAQSTALPNSFNCVDLTAKIPADRNAAPGTSLRDKSINSSAVNVDLAGAKMLTSTSQRFDFGVLWGQVPGGKQIPAGTIYHYELGAVFNGSIYDRIYVISAWSEFKGQSSQKNSSWCWDRR